MTGLVIRNSDGDIMVDMTMSISQHQGYVDTGGAAGSATIPAVPVGKTRFYLVVPLVDLNKEKGKKPGITITGTSMTWSYSFATRNWGYFAANCRIFYGYY